MSTSALSKNTAAQSVAFFVTQSRGKFEAKRYLPVLPNGRIRFDSNGEIEATTAPEDFIVKTSAYTASTGDRIAANTTSAAFTITLPASPTAGNRVQIADSHTQFSTHNL